MRHGPECYELLAEKLEQKTYEEWQPILAENDVPHEKIFGVAEAIAHPQAVANNYNCVINYGEREVNFAMPPVQISTHQPEKRTVAPKVGEHSREVLAAYGFDADEVQALIDCGAVKAM